MTWNFFKSKSDEETKGNQRDKGGIKLFEEPSIYTEVVVQLLSRVPLFATMDCSMPGFPVLQYLLEFPQVQVH